ncbi:hypothetical protein P280DRAFT_362264, partial [Massarina eburnea CBS 473.64]
MEGKNSSGRRISLLNDNPTPPQPLRLPSFTPSLPSRTPSYTSSPVNSPPTPQLVRSNSSDSSADMQSPSPITPEFYMNDLSQPQPQQLASPVFQQDSFFPTPKQLALHYPPVPQPTGPMAYHPQPQPQQQQMPALVPESQNAPSSANPRSKKNSYPCPVSKQFRCTDHFTTSGHAARHAKKHTGKKDAFCPECNKAFTRKDNMEQHRRTHQSGRNAAKGGDVQVKKAKQAAKRPKPAPLQSSMPSLSGLSAMMDPNLPISPVASNFAMAAPAVQPAEFMNDYPQRSPYPDPTTAYSTTNCFTGGSSYGLDALAIAASGEKRKFES